MISVPQFGAKMISVPPSAHNLLIRGKITLMLASNEQCRKQPAVRKNHVGFCGWGRGQVGGVVAHA